MWAEINSKMKFCVKKKYNFDKDHLKLTSSASDRSLNEPGSPRGAVLSSPRKGISSVVKSPRGAGPNFKRDSVPDEVELNSFDDIRERTLSAAYSPLSPRGGKKSQEVELSSFNKSTSPRADVSVEAVNPLTYYQNQLDAYPSGTFESAKSPRGGKKGKNKS